MSDRTQLHDPELQVLLDEYDTFLLIGFKNGKERVSWYLPNDLCVHAIKSKLKNLSDESSVAVQIMLEDSDE